MDWKSIGWPWKAGAAGILVGALLQCLVPFADGGSSAGLLLGRVPIGWFYPGHEMSDLASLVVFAFRNAMPTTPARVAIALGLNALAFIGGAAYFRAMMRGPLWRRGILAGFAGVYFIGPLIATVGIMILVALAEHAGR